MLSLVNVQAGSMGDLLPVCLVAAVTNRNIDDTVLML